MTSPSKDTSARIVDEIISEKPLEERFPLANMQEDERKKIGRLMRELKCPKDFKCVKENFDRLCQARRFGFDEHLECLEKNPSHCPFAVPFINRHICICRMRMHIIQKLKK